jgi:hypothetical protein
MDLQTVANLAEVFGGLVVISGVIFGLVEIRHYREQRQETAAMQIIRAFQSPGFTRALQLVMEYEKECSNCRDSDISESLQEAAMLVSTTIEAIGLMVYRRIVPFRLVQELMGGTVTSSWFVLSPHTKMLREELGRPTVHEWFQWLADRLIEYPEHRDDEGAYHKYTNWQPERQKVQTKEASQ